MIKKETLEVPVKIANLHYPVQFVENLARNYDVIGRILFREQRIEFDQSLLSSPQKLLESLIHEIQHGINDRYGIESFWKDEEGFTEAESKAWATVLEDNPNLVGVFQGLLSEMGTGKDKVIAPEPVLEGLRKLQNDLTSLALAIDKGNIEAIEASNELYKKVDILRSLIEEEII